jgi:hypothetical protein
MLIVVTSSAWRVWESSLGEVETYPSAPRERESEREGDAGDHSSFSRLKLSRSAFSEPKSRETR